MPSGAIRGPGNPTGGPAGRARGREAVPHLRDQAVDDRLEVPARGRGHRALALVGGPDGEDPLDVGASYQRQRAVAAESGGDLKPVVDGLLAEMRDGLPATGPVGRPTEPVPGPGDCAGGHAA